MSAPEVLKAAAAGKTLNPTDNNRVIFNRREKSGQVEIHTSETDLIYVISGRAEFVTGGKPLEAKETAKNELRGTGIENGQTREIKTGDFLVIPKGVPHWFRIVAVPVDYLVVKVH